MNWEYNLSNPPPVWIGSSLHSVIYTNPYAFSKKALKLDTTSSATLSDKGKLIYTCIYKNKLCKNNILFKMTLICNDKKKKRNI